MDRPWPPLGAAAARAGGFDRVRGLSLEQSAALAAPLNRAIVQTRSQAGRSLNNLEAWVAIREANRIFDFDGWQQETIELRYQQHLTERIIAIRVLTTSSWPRIRNASAITATATDSMQPGIYQEIPIP